MSVSFHIAVHICDLHNIKTSVSYQSLFPSIFVFLPNHPSPVNLKPQKVVLEELWISWVIHSTLHRVQIVHWPILVLLSFLFTVKV